MVLKTLTHQLSLLVTAVPATSLNHPPVLGYNLGSDEFGHTDFKLIANGFTVRLNPLIRGRCNKSRESSPTRKNQDQQEKCVEGHYTQAMGGYFCSEKIPGSANSVHFFSTLLGTKYCALTMI
jgi:hypothetical protein